MDIVAGNSSQSWRRRASVFAVRPEPRTSGADKSVTDVRCVVRVANAVRDVATNVGVTQRGDDFTEHNGVGETIENVTELSHESVLEHTSAGCLVTRKRRAIGARQSEGTAGVGAVDVVPNG